MARFEQDLQALADWLLERALEHDKPTLLYELTCEKLRTEQLLRPGVTRLERLVAEARARAQTETYRHLTPRLTKDRQQWLDILLQPDPTRGFTPLSWLRRPAVANSPQAILSNLEKLAFLRNAGVEEWSLEPRPSIPTASNPWRRSRASPVPKRSCVPRPSVAIPSSSPSSLTPSPLSPMR